MARPLTPRTDKRAAITAETVRKWFGKNGAKVSTETIRRLIAAAEFYSAPLDGNEIWRHANFLAARHDLQAAKATADSTMSRIAAAMCRLEDEDLPRGFVQSLMHAWKLAGRLQLSLADFGVLVNDEPITWQEIAGEVVDVIDQAAADAGEKLGKTNKKSGRVLALGGFLDAVGFPVGPDQVQAWMRKNEG